MFFQQLQPQVEEYVPKNVTYRWTRWDVPRFIEVSNTPTEVYKPTPRELLEQTANPSTSSNNSTSEVVSQPVDDFRYDELFEELFGQEDLETGGDLLALEEAVTIDEIFNMSEEIIQEYEFPVVANLAQGNKEDVIEKP